MSLPVLQQLPEFDLQNLIASVGFPITLSMYLLVRIEAKLQTLSDSINELSKNIIDDLEILRGGEGTKCTTPDTKFIHPLPPAGYSPLSQGEKVSGERLFLTD